jgi:hypothetical protein
MISVIQNKIVIRSAVILWALILLGCAAGKSEEQVRGKQGSDTPVKDDVVHGQYIVSMIDGDLNSEAEIRRVLGEFEIVMIRKMDNSGLFLINLKNDPGQDIITKKALSSPRIKAIQPNFRYSIPKPV